MTTNEKVLTVDEARGILRVGRDSMYKLIHSRRVASFKVGRRILVPREAVDRFLGVDPVEKGRVALSKEREEMVARLAEYVAEWKP